MEWFWIFAFFLVCGLIGSWIDHVQLSWLRKRTSHRRLWERAYAESTQRAKLEECLSWIVDAFMLPQKRIFALRPSDRLWEIYRRQNPSFWDNMDFEFLWEDLKDAGHDPEILKDQEITVRDLVELHAGRPVVGS